MVFNVSPVRSPRSGQPNRFWIRSAQLGNSSGWSDRHQR